MIRERFHREIRHQEVSLEQINSSTASLLGAPQSQFPTPQHALMSSNVLPVFVSALESGSKFHFYQTRKSDPGCSRSLMEGVSPYSERSLLKT